METTGPKTTTLRVLATLGISGAYEVEVEIHPDGVRMSPTQLARVDVTPNTISGGEGTLPDDVRKKVVAMVLHEMARAVTAQLGERMDEIKVTQKQPAVASA